MIEKFNFYDIYGYLLPGAIFCTVIAAPFLIVYEITIEWKALAIGIPVAYIIGHVVQRIVFISFHTSIKVNGGRRYHSDIMLDIGGPYLSDGFRHILIQRISQEFGLNVNSANVDKPGEMTQNRRDAFMLCRDRINRDGLKGYVEQYQGMYALMAGTSVACLIGMSLSGGLLASALTPTLPGWAIYLIWFLLLVLFVLLHFFDESPYSLAGVTAAATLVGLMVGESSPVWNNNIAMLLGLIIGTGFVSRRCYRAYRYFQGFFASAVYRGFVIAT